MLERVAGTLVKEIGAEVFFTAISLEEKYGSTLTVEQYALVMGIKVGTVEKRISDETIEVVPAKIGRANMFPVIEVAKVLHNVRKAA